MKKKKVTVRQGGVLSPFLFILFMDECLRDICTREDKEITIAYADDVAIAYLLRSRWIYRMQYTDGKKVQTCAG